MEREKIIACAISDILSLQQVSLCWEMENKLYVFHNDIKKKLKIKFVSLSFQCNFPNEHCKIL